MQWQSRGRFEFVQFRPTGEEPRFGADCLGIRVLRWFREHECLRHKAVRGDPGWEAYMVPEPHAEAFKAWLREQAAEARDG